MEEWFTKAITGWYRKNKRDLPWRKEKDAYKIWLSEIILQQTQVVQGLNYYIRFTRAYPTVKHLASAPEDEVLKLWQGLGYYSRARNLHASAKYILAVRKGEFPSTYKDIRELKGVGDYTAAAIASFAFDLPHAVVDGNVYRLLSRVFGVKTPVDSAAAKKEFQYLAGELLDKKNPAIHNQAIMEYGSQQCKPVNPDCGTCVLSNRCFALKSGMVHVLPVKSKKIKIKTRYFNYLVITDKDKNILISKRSQADIWQGLYEFVLIESEKTLSPADVFMLPEFKSLGISTFDFKYTSKPYKHVLSHQHLHAVFYVIKPASAFKVKKTDYVPVSLAKIDNYAFPRLIGKFMDDCDLKEII